MQDFIAASDTGQLRITTQGRDDIGFDAMAARQQQLAALVGKDANVAGFMSSVGAGGPRATASNGSMLLKLKPADERTGSLDDIIQGLRARLSVVPGIRAFVQNPPAIQIGGRASAGPREYQLARDLGLRSAVTTIPGGLYRRHRDSLTALPRVSLNGLFQARRYMDVFVTPAVFTLMGR